MIDISIDSFLFILILLSAPLIMCRTNHFRTWSFFLINALIYCLTFSHTTSFIFCIIFILFPYIYIMLWRHKNITLVPCISIQVLFFIYLKGYSWIIGPIVGYQHINTFQTLGISYILFRQIDFILQYQAGKIEKIHFILYLNYLLSFWTLLSGPIQRYRDFIQNFDSTQVSEFNWEKHLKLFHRIANGLIKIVIISYFLKNQSDKAFAALSSGEDSLLLFLYWLYGYPLYVYLNFSGYCDVVIASAEYAGFKIPENFDRPYLSRNMIEFWNRWHITLSQWVRDFIYQPLFKKLLTSILKNNPLLSQYISLFITFFIVGIWHGTTINFVIFGLLHGLGMVMSLIYKNVTKKILGKKNFKTYSNHKGIQIIEIVICLHFVCFTFLFFEYDIISVFNILGDIW